jgi:ribonuclease BN (tRNA processing enzyme)
MRLTVLGSSPSWQDAGGACSGYLVQEGDTNLLIDCGSGVFGKLRLQCDYVDVAAVVISHLHADHFFDLVPFASALTYAPRQQPVPVDRWPGTDSPARPELYAPAGALDVFRQASRAGGNERLIENAFGLHEYDASAQLEVGPLRLRFQQVPHYLDTFAICVSSVNGGGRVVYAADCSPNDVLTEFARAAEIMIVEATLPRPERTGVRGHLTPAEAGEHGRAAGAQRLLLTHISDELDWDWARDQAAASFGGPVELAREGAVYDL